VYSQSHPAAIRDAVSYLSQKGFTESELFAALREAESFVPAGRFRDAIARLEAAHVAKVRMTAPMIALLHPERPDWFVSSQWDLDPVLIVAASSYVRDGYTHADLCCLLIVRTAKRLKRQATVLRRKQRLAADPRARALDRAKLRTQVTRRRLREAREQLEQFQSAAASPYPSWTSFRAQQRLPDVVARINGLESALARQEVEAAAP
jgi:hypothetical protein